MDAVNKCGKIRCKKSWESCDDMDKHQEYQNAKAKIWEDVCRKCKYCDSSDNCTACRNCEYKRAIDAIAKVEEYEKIGLSPRKVNETVAENGYLASELVRSELQRINHINLNEKLNFSDTEKKFISLCIYMACKEGFYMLDKDMDEDTVGRSILKKLGFEEKTIDEYMAGY